MGPRIDIDLYLETKEYPAVINLNHLFQKCDRDHPGVIKFYETSKWAPKVRPPRHTEASRTPPSFVSEPFDPLDRLNRKPARKEMKLKVMGKEVNVLIEGKTLTVEAQVASNEQN